MKVKDPGIILSLWKFDHLAVVVEKTTLSTLLYPGFVCHFSTGVHDVQTLLKKRQLDKWVFQIKHLIPKFHVGRVLCVLCCSLCLDCICRIQKNFYLETRVWVPIIMKTKVDYNLATSLEIEDITCQRGDMRSLVKYFFSTWEEKFRISKRPCYVLFLI